MNAQLSAGTSSITSPLESLRTNSLSTRSHLDANLNICSFNLSSLALHDGVGAEGVPTSIFLKIHLNDIFSNPRHYLIMILLQVMVHLRQVNLHLLELIGPN